MPYLDLTTTTEHVGSVFGVEVYIDAKVHPGTVEPTTRDLEFRKWIEAIEAAANAALQVPAPFIQQHGSAWPHRELGRVFLGGDDR